MTGTWLTAAQVTERFPKAIVLSLPFENYGAVHPPKCCPHAGSSSFAPVARLLPLRTTQHRAFSS